MTLFYSCPQTPGCGNVATVNGALLQEDLTSVSLTDSFPVHHVAALDGLLQLHPVNERKREGLERGGLHFIAQLATPRAKSRSEGGKTGEWPSETTFSSSLPFLHLPLHTRQPKIIPDVTSRVKAAFGLQ